jgi:hypothetical protein
VITWYNIKVKYKKVDKIEKALRPRKASSKSILPQKEEI